MRFSIDHGESKITSLLYKIIENCSASDCLNLKKHSFFFHRLQKNIVWKYFVLLHYSILKSMLNKNVILIKQPKQVHKHFEQVGENVFSLVSS